MIFMRFPGGLVKALTFSYDDGTVQDERLVQILNKHKMKGTFNLNSGLYATKDTRFAPGDPHRRMTAEQISNLFSNGPHEVAVHALTHCSFTEVPSEQIVSEIMLDRMNLEHMFARQVHGMAYPFGTLDDRVAETARSCGIEYARTIQSTHGFELPGDWLHLNPTCHHNDPELMLLADRFMAAKNAFYCKLFYVWGHSFEFERDDNWKVIEDFCDRLANQPSIWYATNGEIVEYVNAFRQLKFSADGQIIFNPTGRTLWFEKDCEPVALSSGEVRTFHA